MRLRVLRVGVTRGESADGIRHGTSPGFSRHQRRGEEPCESCRAAKAAVDRSWRAAPDRVKINRIHSRAQSLALRFLRRRHLAEYRALYSWYRTKLLREHGLLPGSDPDRGGES